MFEINSKQPVSLKNISLQDFLNLGIRDLAYIRPVFLDDRQAYAIHAADGTPLSVMENMQDAVFAVRQNDLTAVTLH